MSIISSVKRNVSTLVMVGTVFVLASVVAIILFIQIIEQLRLIAYQRLELQANTITAQAREKYRGGTTTLHSLQGFFAGSQEVTRAEFNNFIQISDFNNSYPGFSAIAYIKKVASGDKEKFLTQVRSDTSVNQNGYPQFNITPEGNRSEYWPITYISTGEDTSLLLGSDQQTDTIRSENIARARDIGSISVSKMVELKQGGVGEIIAAPIYRSDSIPQSLEDRRRLFEGAVTISLIKDQFYNPILSTYDLESDRISIQITSRDGKPVDLSTHKTSRDFITSFFGFIEIKQKLELDSNNSFDFTFTAPVISQLSGPEALEPFLVLLISFSAALVVSVIIIVSQKLRLAKDLKVKYTFITTLSHQLRTPLTNLRWQLESQKVAAKDKKIHKILTKNVLVLDSIVSRMLLYIEMVEKGIDTSKSKVKAENLYTLVLKAVSESKNTSQIQRIGKRPITKRVLIDEEKTILAIKYIIENAITYSPVNKPITIELKVRDQSVDFIIADSGFGIPDVEQKKMFSEFFRASNASLGINYGSGVSVFMAKKIVEANGGNISFVSHQNKGSVFTIRLPLVK